MVFDYAADTPWVLNEAVEGAIERASAEDGSVATENTVYFADIAYAMGTVSARLPDDLEAELEAYIDEEHLDRSTAVRKLLAEGLEAWQKERALEQLRAGEVTFTRAAEIAGLNVWDFAQLVRERDVTWVSEVDIDADLAAY